MFSAMKIWYNSTLLFSSSDEFSQYDRWPDNDWDDWPDSNRLRNHYESGMLTPQSPTLTLPAAIQTQAYDDAHWIVSSPAEQSFIAILDVRALQLLQQFRQPLTMIEALQRAGKGNAFTVLRAVQHFVVLGLLHHMQKDEAQSEVVQGHDGIFPLSEALRREATLVLQQGQLLSF